MTERCHRCDRPYAGPDAIRHADGCECPTCLSSCWSRFGQACLAVDWRARALEAERRLAAPKAGSDKQPWDADCDASRPGLERLMRALILVDGHFTDSFSLAPVDKPARVSVFLRVWLKPGTESRFIELAKVDELRPPPRVHLGIDPCPDDGRRPIARAKAVRRG